MFSLTNAEIQDVSNIHLGIKSLPLLKSDILPSLQVSKPLKSLQIKTAYIKLASIALNCQTSNKKEVSHESEKSGKNLA